jgi:hypothetical protein
MAERLVLVPESLAGKLNVGDKSEHSLSEICGSLPKRLQRKARSLIEYIDGNVVLNDDQRVVYPGGEVGSHIADLIKYFVSKPPRERPLDAPQFESLIMKAGVPSDAVIRPSPMPKKWHSL